MKLIIDVDENLVCDGFERPFTEEERNTLIRAVGNGRSYNPAEDCISREYVEGIVEELENICQNAPEEVLDLLSNVRNAPPVDPERPQAEWVDSPDGLPKCCCSLCGAKNVTIWRSFCPNCGASMQGGAE